MKFKDYQQQLTDTEVAILNHNGRMVAVTAINAEGGVCDCCYEIFNIGEAELIMVKDVMTHDIVFEPSVVGRP